MVNTTSKIKRKSDYNRTRLSRRVKRGGAWLNNDTILNETQYLKTYNLLKNAPYNLTDENINNGKFYTVNDSNRQIILDLLDRLNKYKQKRLHVYKELLKECVPVYPYARVEMDKDRASIAFKERIRIEMYNKYTNRDYEIEAIGPYGSYGKDYTLSH
jgi:hypothetical protein